MKEGKEVRRQVWLNKAYRMYLEHEMITAKTHRSKNLIEKAYFKTIDFEADDWEYYKEPVKTLSNKVELGNVIGKNLIPKAMDVYKEKDVKEFIMRIKGIGWFNSIPDDTRHDIFIDIDKLAGDRFK